MWYPVSGLTAMELLKDNVLPTYSWICSDWEIYWDHHGHFEQIQVWTLFLANHSKKHQSISPWTADKFLWKLAHGLSLSPSSYGSFTAVSWTFYRLFRLWVLERSWGFLIIAISNLEDFLVVGIHKCNTKKALPKDKVSCQPRIHKFRWFIRRIPQIPGFSAKEKGYFMPTMSYPRNDIITMS